MDSLNVSSENLFSKDFAYFYSYNVKNEVDVVYSKKHKQFKLFFLMLTRFFSNYLDYSLINELETHALINNMEPIGNLDVNDMHFALNVIWNRLNFDENHDAFDVKNKFSIFKDDFHSLHKLKKEEIFSNLILVPNHTKKDKMILNKIIKENLRDELLHKSDEDILFDANEFACDNPDLNLKFVSADQDFLSAVNILLEYLCFDEAIDLLKFSNN